MGKSSGGIRKYLDMGYSRSEAEGMAAADRAMKENLFGTQKGLDNLLKNQNVKTVYESLEPTINRGTYKTNYSSTYDYGSTPNDILRAVALHGSGTGQAIANDFLDRQLANKKRGYSDMRYPLSDKQKWAVAYAYLKLKPDDVNQAKNRKNSKWDFL